MFFNRAKVKDKHFSFFNAIVCKCFARIVDKSPGKKFIQKQFSFEHFFESAMYCITQYLM